MQTLRFEDAFRGLILLGVVGFATSSVRAAGIEFEGRLLPIFEKKCFECHGEVDEPKGGLRLDGAKSILKGGENGPVVVPGDTDASPLLVRTSLGQDHEDYMPKEGTGLSALERAFLKRWISEGADFGDWVGKVAVITPDPGKTVPAPTEGKPGGTEVVMVPGAGTPGTPGTTPATPGAPSAQTVDFERHVLPLLRNKCFECHKAPYQDGVRLRKPKASLRLDAARGIMIGSGDGEVIVVGDHRESTIFMRVDLPPGDDDIMPPEGDGAPLTDTEKRILGTWIDEGANFNGWVGNEEGFSRQMAEPTDSGPSAADLLAQQVKGASVEALRAVAATGALISQVAIGNPLLRVEYITEESKLGNEQVATIEPLAGNVTELDLSETAVTDEGLAMLGKFDKLTYLDLHNTQITNATIEAIQGLVHLEYLNLYGTKVDNGCLPMIFKFRKLKAVYLWKTGVTEEEAEKLRKGLPDAKVNL